MRQIYATKIQCNLCGAQDDVLSPSDVTAQPKLPPGWMGPVYMSTDYHGMTPMDFCAGCAGMPFRDLHARLRELEKVANG